jgi:Tfp pilus assembly protein PilP
MSLWKKQMRKNSHRIFFVLCLSFIAMCLFVSRVSAVEPAAGKATPFHYRSQGKLDPFKPFIKKEIPGQKRADSKFLSPLQRYGIEQLKLIGIMASENSNQKRAIVADPKGKSFIIMKGSLIGQNSGRVAEILDDQVIVEEKTGEDSRKVKTKRIILDLHRVEREGKL